MASLARVSQRWKGVVLERVRQGGRTVLWHGQDLGFANHLYLWQAAWLARESGKDVRVLEDPRMAPWLEYFPALRPLVLSPSEVRLRDGRTLHDQQVFGLDYTPDQLESFVRACLLPRLPDPSDSSGTDASVTLNVRRGDYYSVPRFRGSYSIDTLAYASAALDRAESLHGSAGSLVVVSDDPSWCRERLGHLGEGRELVVMERETPWDHFATLASSRRLVLTNSTFSYWGAYVSNIRYGDNHDRVVAPWFHRRDIDAGKAWQLDPRWTIVRSIPGGWDS